MFPALQTHVSSGAIFGLCYDNAVLHRLCCWNNSGRDSFFSMGEESACFGVRAADFKTIVARSIFRPAWPPQGGREPERDVLIEFGLKAAPGLCLVAGEGNGKWDWIWLNNGKIETVVPTSLQRPVSTTTSQIELLHSTDRLCSGPTEHMWTWPNKFCLNVNMVRNLWDLKIGM